MDAPQHRITLAESEMPTRWYNIVADLPEPLPPMLHPGTHEPVGPEDLAPLFPPALIEQELGTERYYDIPEEVQEVYRLWRPSPLIRATRLERELGTPARLYVKYEGVSPAGSHKPNSAVPQAYYNHQAGITRLTTETGAGQWGASLAFACAQYAMECEVWQVAGSFDSKPYRRLMMETFGAQVHRSPSDLTEAGRVIQASHPGTTGSLGIAISEAVEAAVQSPTTSYALGSVLNHVLLHQTIIGEETLLQLAKVGETPDLLIGCTGGGSNFAGLAFPFLRETWGGRMTPALRAVEPAACPSLTRGTYAYDSGDVAGMTPLMKMHTLGSGFMPSAIHAGGLRYHGMAPLVSHLYHHGHLEAVAKEQAECFDAGALFARCEGIIPAPESTHAIAELVAEGRRCAESGEEKVVVVGLSGHGHLELPAYGDHTAGRLRSSAADDPDLDAHLRGSMAALPEVRAS